MLNAECVRCYTVCAPRYAICDMFTYLKRQFRFICFVFNFDRVYACADGERLEQIDHTHTETCFHRIESCGEVNGIQFHWIGLLFWRHISQYSHVELNFRWNEHTRAYISEINSCYDWWTRHKIRSPPRIDKICQLNSVRIQFNRTKYGVSYAWHTNNSISVSTFKLYSISISKIQNQINFWLAQTIWFRRNDFTLFSLNDQMSSKYQFPTKWNRNKTKNKKYWVTRSRPINR